jgi:hypothetical protein
MPLCLDSCVLHSHVYLIHEHYQIPSDRLHRLDDANVHLLFLVPYPMIMIIGLKFYLINNNNETMGIHD